MEIENLCAHNETSFQCITPHSAGSFASMRVLSSSHRTTMRTENGHTASGIFKIAGAHSEHEWNHFSLWSERSISKQFLDRRMSGKSASNVRESGANYVNGIDEELCKLLADNNEGNLELELDNNNNNSSCFNSKLVGKSSSHVYYHAKRVCVWSGAGRAPNIRIFKKCIEFIPSSILVLSLFHCYSSSIGLPHFAVRRSWPAFFSPGSLHICSVYAHSSIRCAYYLVSMRFFSSLRRPSNPSTENVV